MPGSARRIVIEFLGDASSLNRAMDSAERKSTGLGGKLKNLGKVAAVGLGAGVVFAGKALVDMTKNASEDEAAQRRLATALKNSTGARSSDVASVESWISKQGVALGVTDDELRPALQRLVQSTGDVGKAQSQLKIAMDVSAGTGKSLKTVTEAMMKANNGTTASLSKLGLKTKDAEGNTLSMKDALKSMSDTFKGQAEKQANSLEGKMGRLKLMFDETKESIGAKLIPIATKMADIFLNKVVPAVSAAGDWIHDHLFPVIGQISDVVKKVFGRLNGDVSGPMKDIQSTIKSAVSIIQSLWKRFGGFITEYLRGSFKNAFTIIKGAFKIISGIFKVFSSLLKGDWKGVWQGIKQILSGAFSVLKGVVKQGLNVIKTIFKIGWSALKGVVSGAFGGIKDAVSSGIGRVMDLVRGLPGKIRDLGGNMLSAGKDLIGKLFDGVLSAARSAGGFVGSLVESIKSAINSTLHLPLEVNFDKGPIHIHATVIPAFAKGGITPGGLILAGEEGPELIDVARGSRVRTASQTRRMLASAGGAGLTVNIYGALDPVAVGRQVEQVLVKYQRVTGRKLQITTN